MISIRQRKSSIFMVLENSWNQGVTTGCIYFSYMASRGRCSSWYVLLSNLSQPNGFTPPNSSKAMAPAAQAGKEKRGKDTFT